MEIIKEINFKETDCKKVLECGKVFVTNSRWFILNCCLCGKKLEREKFFEHVLEVHLDVEYNSNLDLKTQKKIEDEKSPQKVPDEDKKYSDNFVQNVAEKEQKIQIKEINIKLHSLENNGLTNIPKITNKNDEENDGGECLEQQKLKTAEEKQSNTFLQCTEKSEYLDCDICNIKLNKRSELLNHKRNKCGFRCSFCSLILKEENLLGTHLKTHNIRKRAKEKTLDKNKQVFVCEICGKNFNDSSNLRAHIKKHDPTRKIYPCEKCDKKFLKETSLENHFKLKHLKDKPFVCKVALCGRSFVNEKSLENHKAFHGERKYQCSTCNKKYLYKSKLKEHVKLYHIQGRIHHCPECDKSFYDQWTLKSHMVCHSGAKPYECDECDAKFPREKALMWHKKVHSGIKDYICKLCNQAFYIYNGLYAHMKSHNIKYSKNMEKDLLLMSNEKNNKNIENE